MEFFELFFTIVFIIGFPICISDTMYELYTGLYGKIKGIHRPLKQNNSFPGSTIMYKVKN